MLLSYYIQLLVLISIKNFNSSLINLINFCFILIKVFNVVIVFSLTVLRKKGR